MPRNDSKARPKSRSTPTTPILINPAEVLEERIRMVREQVRNHKQAAEEGHAFIDKLLRIQADFGRS